jgi:hypothetical protein
LLTIDVEPGDIDKKRLTEAQEKRHIYGYAMAGYIRWLAKDYEAITARYLELMLRVRNEQTGDAHGRLSAAMATLYAAFMCALEYAQEVGVIDGSIYRDLGKECYVTLRGIAGKQAELVANSDPVLQYLQTLVTLLYARQIQIPGTAHEAALGAGLLTSAVESVGWHDGTYVYLTSLAYHRVVRYYASQGDHYPCDETTLRKEMARQGLLAKKNQGRNDYQSRVPGQPGARERVIVIELRTLLDTAATAGFSDNELYARQGEGASA